VEILTERPDVGLDRGPRVEELPAEGVVELLSGGQPREPVHVLNQRAADLLQSALRLLRLARSAEVARLDRSTVLS